MIHYMNYIYYIICNKTRTHTHKYILFLHGSNWVSCLWHPLFVVLKANQKVAHCFAHTIYNMGHMDHGPYDSYHIWACLVLRLVSLVSFSGQC